MSILGLTNTEQFAEERFTSIRRAVFYQYPNGAAPLLGLLSMLDGEVLHDPEYTWYEKRLKERLTHTVGAAWFADNAGAVGAAVGAGASPRTAGTIYWLAVIDPEIFTEHSILRSVDNPVTGGKAEIQFKVVPNAAGIFVNTTTGTTPVSRIRVTPITTVAAVLNPVIAVDDAIAVQVFGTANAQGQVGADEGCYNLPASVSNAAQIFRDKYSFTNTAMKTSAKFDETGIYKDKAKEISMQHMIGMERQFIFGDYSKSIDAQQRPTYTTGGILFFLKLWEVGTGNSHAGVQNPYGNSAATQNSDDNKRIININGNISESDLDDYYERLFRYTNNVSNEKMAFVGSGFLNVMNKLYKSNVTLNADIPSTDAYGMNVVKHTTPFGDVYYKSHPLFSQSPILRHNALFLDVQNMKYRYVDGRDTDTIKNTQPNNADYREDELRAECGLELQFPEANLYMVGVTGVQ